MDKPDLGEGDRIAVLERPLGAVPPPRCTPARAESFADVLGARAAAQGERTAFVFIDFHGHETERATYAQLDRRARALACDLVRRGLGGQRVLLVFPSGLDFVVALFACFQAGAVAVPIPFIAGKRTAERMALILADADAAAVLTCRAAGLGRELQSIAEDAGSRLAWIHLDGLDPAGEIFDLDPVGPDALALMQYTSGSTSAPKGVMLSHGALMANNAMIAAAFGHDETLRGVGWLPLFHDMGLVGHVLQPIYAGGLSVLMSPLSFLQRPLRWLQAISDWGATTSGGPCHAYDLCLRALRDQPVESIGLDLGRWAVAYCGSEPVRAGVMQRFAERFAPAGFDAGALHPCYGMAEATLLVTSVGRGEPLRTLGASVSCGRSWSGSSVLIADPETGAVAPDGQVGEIRVTGAHVGQGYWGRTDSADVFAAPVEGQGGAWLKTGDLGFLDQGELFVVGRMKNTIIVMGVKHAAEDLESTTAASHPAFAHAASAAFAIEADGQERAVMVQEAPRLAGAAAEQVQAVGQAVGQAFAAVTRNHSLRLHDFVLVRSGALPRTSSGKVQRARAREIYEAGGFDRLNPDGALFASPPAAQPAGA